MAERELIKQYPMIEGSYYHRKEERAKPYLSTISVNRLSFPQTAQPKKEWWWVRGGRAD